MKKVLIATPAYDGRLDVWYVNSLVNTVRLLESNGIEVHPIYLAYDAMIQRARNNLFRLAMQGNFTDMVFIDSDMEWDPAWVMSLLAREEDVVGGTARKKTDEVELYAVKTHNVVPNERGLIQAEGLGTGFVKLSRTAFEAAWNASPSYINEGEECRMVCDVQVIDGELYSEDTFLFRKLRGLGFIPWLDPTMTCNHIGVKKYVGNIAAFLARLQPAPVESCPPPPEAVQ